MARRPPVLSTAADIADAAAERPRLSGLEAARKTVQAAHQPSDSQGPQVGFAPYEAGTIYPCGAFVRLPLDRVIENPENPRALYPYGELQSLMVSISTIGQQEPAKVFYSPEHSAYMLKGGHRRHRALTNLGKEFINVEVVEHLSDAFEQYRQARDLNGEAKTHTHLDDAVRLPVLMQKYGLKDQKELAAKLKMSQGELSRRLKIGVLPNDVLELLAEDIASFGSEACYQLALIWERRKDHAFLHKVIGRVQEGLGNVGLREIAAAARTPANVARVDAEDTADAESMLSTAKRNLPIARADMGGKAKGVIKAFSERLEVRLEVKSPALRERLYKQFLTLCESEGILSKAGVRAPEA